MSNKIDCYAYDRLTKNFTRVTDAWESPLEPGVFLLPADATFDPPPSKDVHWTGEKWEDGKNPDPREKHFGDDDDDKLPPRDDLIESNIMVRIGKAVREAVKDGKPETLMAELAKLVTQVEADVDALIASKEPK